MPLAISIRYEFLDESGKTSFTKIRVPNGFSLANYTEFAQAMGQIISDMKVGVLTRAGVCVGLDLSGSTIKAVADIFSDVLQKARVHFASALQGFSGKMLLPAFDELNVVAGSDEIDQTDPDVAAFITAMENGIAVTLGTIAPTDDRENDLTSVLFFREEFKDG
ncbi:MAG: hypothetical protein GWN00_08640 [Aliifodinibius sp.]|nr:hypothetical protein [Fodinibius sp.]NIY24869.1 hypothetical protein [Fodinibius sp.]